jgi:hypothetical protein
MANTECISTLQLLQVENKERTLTFCIVCPWGLSSQARFDGDIAACDAIVRSASDLRDVTGHVLSNALMMNMAEDNLILRASN